MNGLCFVDLTGKNEKKAKQLQEEIPHNNCQIILHDHLSTNPLDDIYCQIKVASTVIILGHETLSSAELQKLHQIANESRTEIWVCNQYNGMLPFPKNENKNTLMPYHIDLIVQAASPSLKHIRSLIEYLLFSEETDLSSQTATNAITTISNEINLFNFRLSFQNGSTVNATIVKSVQENLIINFANLNSTIHKSFTAQELPWLFLNKNTIIKTERNQLTNLYNELRIRSIQEDIVSRIHNKIAF